MEEILHEGKTYGDVVHHKGSETEEHLLSEDLRLPPICLPIPEAFCAFYLWCVPTPLC